MSVRNILKLIGFFAAGMVGGIFADQVLWTYFIEKPLFFQYNLDNNPVTVVEKKETIIQENAALTKAIEKGKNSILAVRSYSSSGSVEGSGLIITSDGLIVTLAELVPQGYSFIFSIDGKTAPYQVLKRDQSKNLALIKLQASSLPTLGFADSGAIKLGERIFLIGEISDKNGPYKVVNEGIVRNFSESLIETNMSEKSVLKGSTLFNIKGEVLGINTVNSQGRIVSIPVSTIKEFAGL